MPKRSRKVKEDFWVWAIAAAIVVYALLASWWKEHAVLGWIILSVLLVLMVYVLYRYASLRGWLGHQVKNTIQKAISDEVASDREPLSSGQRDAILKRAKYRCENESCSYQGKPHIHHIDMNNQNNNLNNLIALCPSCHQKAHDGKFTQSQLFNWARRDFKKLQARRTWKR